MLDCLGGHGPDTFLLKIRSRESKMIEIELAIYGTADWHSSRAKILSKIEEVRSIISMEHVTDENFIFRLFVDFVLVGQKLIFGSMISMFKSAHLHMQLPSLNHRQ